MLLGFMILALGLAGITAYAITCAHKLQEASAAHATADAHTDAAAQAVQDTVNAANHSIEIFRAAYDRAKQALHVANAANEHAIAKTAEADKLAKTPQEKQAVAAQASATIDRHTQIQAMLAKLGVGQCGVRTYPHVTARARDALLARLRSEGMTVTGAGDDGIYDINTHEPDLPLVTDVKLRATWDAASETLYLIVTAGRGSLVTCDKIWQKIEPKLQEVIHA